MVRNIFQSDFLQVKSEKNALRVKNVAPRLTNSHPRLKTGEKPCGVSHSRQLVHNFSEKSAYLYLTYLQYMIKLSSS